MPGLPDTYLILLDLSTLYPTYEACRLDGRFCDDAQLGSRTSRAYININPLRRLTRRDTASSKTPVLDSIKLNQSRARVMPV